MSARRGQAVVELAVTLTFLTSVILGGLYFYEAMRAMVMVDVGSASVIFESTAYSTRSMSTMTPTNCRPLLASGGGSLSRAITRQGLYTQGQPLALDCTQVLGNQPSCTGGLPSFFTRPIIDKKARYTFNLSSEQRFLGDTGAFIKGQSTWSASSLKLCGLGLAQGGTCPLEYTLINEDWHVEDDRNCYLVGCQNLEYQADATRLFSPSTGAGPRLATFVTGSSPIDDRDVFFSRANIQTMFLDPTTPAGDVRRKDYETGPGPARRNRCYLGRTCP
jgi:hypothetical protein